VPYNFVADSFTRRNFVADFLLAKCDFHVKRHFAFLVFLRGLRVTYDDYLRLIGKHVVDFLLVLVELLSLGVMAEVL